MVEYDGPYKLLSLIDLPMKSEKMSTKKQSRRNWGFRQTLRSYLSRASVFFLCNYLISGQKNAPVQMPLTARQTFGGNERTVCNPR